MQFFSVAQKLKARAWKRLNIKYMNLCLDATIKIINFFPARWGIGYVPGHFGTLLWFLRQWLK